MYIVYSLQGNVVSIILHLGRLYLLQNQSPNSSLKREAVIYTSTYYLMRLKAHIVKVDLLDGNPGIVVMGVLLTNKKLYFKSLVPHITYLPTYLDGELWTYL